jgi:putative Mg2+ transporter-C (MgtC) family protein
MDVAEILLKLVVVFVLSAIFGIERQTSHKPVGFGTFIFVALGACGLTLTAMNLGLDRSMSLLSATVTGVGFLGAGALIKSGDRLFGAKTAAGIWLFAIIGVIVGVGEYWIAMIVYSFVWLTVFGDRLLEMKGIGSYQKKIVIVTNKIIDETEIESVINPKKSKVLSIEVNKPNNKINFSYLIEGTKDEINDIPKKLYKKEWFESFKVE